MIFGHSRSSVTSSPLRLHKTLVVLLRPLLGPPFPLLLSVLPYSEAYTKDQAQNRARYGHGDAGDAAGA